MSAVNGKFRNLLLIINDNAGKGLTEAKKEIIFSYLVQNNCEFTVINLDEFDRLEDLNIFDAVVAVGGDGSVLRVLSRLVNTDIKLGIIPCGTANLFAASLCIPENIQKAIDIILNGSTAKVDIGKAGNEYFALRIGIGYDAEVVTGANKFWKNRIGYLSYLIQGIVSSFKLSRKSYKIVIDNREMVVNANSIIIANAGNMFKNLFSVAPSGSISDGKLDIFIFAAKNLWEFLLVLFRILAGKEALGKNVIYAKATNIRIDTDYRDVHIDGEPCKYSNLDISVIPRALKVMVP